MEEFATLSGISRPTISKYFNDPGSVRQSTRERIEKALERYDYRPNIYAINQNRRLTKTVGIIVPYLADPFFAEIARNIERRCLDAGFWPILFSAHGSQALENDILDSLRSLKPAGVLFAPLGRGSDRSAVEKFCRDVPTILFDSNIDGIGEAFIGLDNFQSVSMIVEYLCRTGEPPCFFEMRHPANPNANKRREAYLATMERLGHQPHVLRAEGRGLGVRGNRPRGRRTHPRRTPSCVRYRTLQQRPAGDRLPHRVLRERAEGRRGPGCALRVAGHDDHPFSRYTCPPLTTVAQDYHSISNHSVEALFALVEGDRPRSRTQTLFKGELIMRESA